MLRSFQSYLASIFDRDRTIEPVPETVPETLPETLPAATAAVAPKDQQKFEKNKIRVLKLLNVYYEYHESIQEIQRPLLMIFDGIIMSMQLMDVTSMGWMGEG